MKAPQKNGMGQTTDNFSFQTGGLKNFPTDQF